MPGDSLTVLVFDVAGQRCGVPASDVQELLRAVAVAPLPGAPAGVDGVINLRGRVVPVLQLRARFGLPATELSPDEHFLVVRAAGRLVALRIDRAVDLVEMDGGVEEVAGVLPGAGRLGRVARWGQELVLLPDLPTLFSQVEALAVEGGPP